jgi:LPS sulfotransferase NodH
VNLIKVTDSTFVDCLRKHQIDSFSPIIIATMPRSGSTLLEQILSAHSQVKSCGETDFFYRFYNQSAQYLPQGKMINEISDNELAKYVTSSHSKIQEGFSKFAQSNQKIVDKSMSNFTEIGKILSIYPNAKVLYCHRHPLAIALSCYQHYFTGSNEFTYKLENIAAANRGFTLMMNHWQKLFPNNVLRIDYETLTAEQEKITRKLLNFCELSWEDECLSFQDNKQMVFTASTAQVRDAMHTNANERWKLYREHLRPVSDILNLSIEDGTSTI